MPIKTYIKLTKPGIIMGNAITAAAGFMLASRNYFNPWLFLAALGGLSLIVGAGCVLNNYMDRDTDKKMTRTQNRALATGAVSTKNALIFGVALLAIGSAALILFTNMLTLSVALAGFVIYVFFYGLLKYRTVYGTEIGSIAGAVPPVVGYCAVTQQFDGGALLLFLIIALWQMPHFFAIALYRSKEYAAASIPVLPLVKGINITKIRMALYTVAFIASTILLTFFGYTGYAYLSVSVILGVIWLALCIKGFKAVSNEKWAHKMFRYSLIVVTILCIMISVDAK
jgi:protoheme IX farnesyltransferase